MSGAALSKSLNTSEPHFSLLQNKEKKVYKDELLLVLNIIIYVSYVYIQISPGAVVQYLQIQYLTTF